MPESASERFQLAQKLASVKQNVAQAISRTSFLSTIPIGLFATATVDVSSARQMRCFHMEFLAGAIEAGSPEAFADYSRWTARMLGARGIAAHTLDENFAQLEKHLSAELLPEERASQF